MPLASILIRCSSFPGSPGLPIIYQLRKPGMNSPSKDPSRLLEDISAWINPSECPTVPSRTSCIFRAEEGGPTYAHHPYITRYDHDEFWGIWATGFCDGDRPGQLIGYSRSTNGHDWETLTSLPFPNHRSRFSSPPFERPPSAVPANRERQYTLWGLSRIRSMSPLSRPSLPPHSCFLVSFSLP